VDISVDESHRQQAAAFLGRWRARAERPRAAEGTAIPERIELPPRVWRHYRHFAWVSCEQRLFLLMLAALASACGLVWMAAWGLRSKPAAVIRAGPSLKQAAAAFYGAPEISYDQLSFFLHGCLPLLYEAGHSEHPLLALAEGLVAPEIAAEAQRRLAQMAPAIAAHGISQALVVTGVTDVVADQTAGRAAATVDGRLIVTLRGSEAQVFPWRARAVLAVNPGGRLDPYPFYLLSIEEERR
jgi:hypothetical protein